MVIVIFVILKEIIQLEDDLFVLNVEGKYIMERYDFSFDGMKEKVEGDYVEFDEANNIITDLEDTVNLLKLEIGALLTDNFLSLAKDVTIREFKNIVEYQFNTINELQKASSNLKIEDLYEV